jgi:polyhydroxyalkanoate synthase
MSFVKWAVDKGFTVFMISWVNPNKEHRDKGFENYLSDGLLNSIDKIHEITNASSIHTFGYCVGGTLISTLLAYLANPKCSRYPKARIDTATLLTTLLDFDKAGDMGIFMAEEYLGVIKTQLGDKGYLDGKVMFNTFNVLKANDMIWRYFINNYMLGKKPTAHEILYWNSDQTNITESMQIFLSKDLYRDNLLKTGALKIFGIPIDLKEITTPLYMVSMIKDHLVPWKATFDSLKIFKNNIRFVLGGSGHVAGAINPPLKNKYCYWINGNNASTTTAEEWLETATKISGSWWNDWFEWIKPMAGECINPVAIKKFLRNAPGTYVHTQTMD